MKALVLWVCALACAEGVEPPECRGGACVARDVARDVAGGWLSRDYLVNGKRMSIATHADAIRWTCWGGDPTDPSAPHYLPHLPLSATAVELIDCDVPSKSYQELFEALTLSWNNVRDLTIINRSKNVQWPSSSSSGHGQDLEELQGYIDTYVNEKGEWITAAAAKLPRNSLNQLSLHGTPMSTEQLISIYGIWTLTLKHTGLTRVMNLSEFSSLYRVVLDEPTLEDAQMLASAPALDNLVLHAPDAGLAPMPHLRVATFLNVYAIGSIFGNCKKLEELTIKGGELDRIHKHWLAGCTALNYLKLSRLSNLRNLPDDLLSDTMDLRVLDLSHNSLESLPEGLFSNIENLTILNLRNNSLIELPMGLLPPPKSLKYMCLSDSSDSIDTQLKSSSVWFYNNCAINKGM